MTMMDTSGFTVAAAGEAAIRCMDCNLGYNESVMSKLTSLFNMNRSFSCPKCNREYSSVAEFEVWVTPSAAKFFNEDVVRSATWFHATDNPHWFEDLLAGGDISNRPLTPGDVMVHLGTEESARARADQRHDEYLSYGIEIRNWYLYEVQLKASAFIHPDVQDDENNFPEFSNSVAEPYFEWTPEGITRYVNAYEVAGSVSLLANINSFNVLMRHDL